MLSYPSSRATSSTRSAGRVRSGRQLGGVTTSTELPASSRQRRRRRSRPGPAAGRDAAARSGGPASRSGSPIGRVTGSGSGGLPTSVRPASTAPPPYRASSAAAHSAADRRHLRVDTALEAPGRLARQLVPSGGPGDHRRIPVRRLDHHIGGTGADLGGLATHHPGQRDGAGVVGDHQIVRIQGAVDAVEGAQRLARLGPPDHDLAGACPASKACSGWPYSSIT